MQHSDSDSGLPLRRSLTVQLIKSVTHCVALMLTSERHLWHSPSVYELMMPSGQRALWSAGLFSASLANLASVSVSHMLARFQTAMEIHSESHRKDSCIWHIFDVFFVPGSMILLFIFSLETAGCITVYCKASDCLNSIAKLSFFFRPVNQVNVLQQKQLYLEI